MRRFSVALLTAVVVLTGCGGTPNEPTSEAGSARTATPTVGVEETPEDIPFVASSLTITGDTGALVVAGEVVEIDHLVRNLAGNSRSAAFRVSTESVDLVVELSDDSSRLKAGEIEALASIVTIPDDAQPGQVYEYEVLVANVEDTSDRSVTAIQLLVVEAAGDRPTAGADAGITAMNERVVVYVVGDDSDPDGDLDLQSLRVVAGGFAADQISGDGNGTITYIPFANVTGRDFVMYEICDDEARCDPTLLTIDVTD
jgi:hypothetical protein